MRKKRTYVVSLFALLSVLCFLVPDLIFGLNPDQHRMLGIVVLAIVLWVSEVIPGYATGLIIIALELIFLSDKGLKVVQSAEPSLDYRQVMASLASPIVILFLGGFAIASTATKYKLDLSIAKTLLRPFGQSTGAILFGLMAITAVFSMFMSNTATAAMMLAILTPVIAGLPATDPARKSFLLAIPVAANVGGMGTPIGTPPNAIALKYLTGENTVTFAQWMLIGIPIVLVLIAFSWWLLKTLYPPESKSLVLNIKSPAIHPVHKWIFYGTFAATVALWLTGDLHGMNSYVVGILPLTVFVATGMLDTSDIRTFNWEVLWLISGGIALGDGMAKTGLSGALMDMVPSDGMTGWTAVGICTAIAFLMGNFVSHTVAANVILPLTATIIGGLSADTAAPGSRVAIVTVALVCSLGMALPISTPPNALAYATGKVQARDFMRAGGIISLFGVALVVIASALFL
jgi:sodium-dependent dicarboxylate transporter 2/3/5